MQRGTFQIGEIERRRGVVATPSFSSSYNRRPPDEFELNSHPHPVHQPTYRGRGGRGRGGQNGSRVNRRGGFGGFSIDKRPAERCQSSASSSFGGLAQGFSGAPTRQEKESTAAFAKQMEQKQDEVGYYTTDEDGEEMEEEVSMVKKTTEKENWNRDFEKDVHGETKKYGGVGGDGKEEKKVNMGFTESVEKQLPLPFIPFQTLDLAKDKKSAEVVFRDGSYNSSSFPPPTAIPAPQKSCQTFKLGGFVSSSDPPGFPPFYVHQPSFGQAGYRPALRYGAGSTSSRNVAALKCGPDGIIYTLDNKLPIRRKRSIGKLVLSVTKEIKGGQIATHLETDKIYEVLVNCQTEPVLVTIDGTNENTVVFGELGLRPHYEAPFDSLRLYEMSGTVPSSLEPAPDLSDLIPAAKFGPDGICYTIDPELSTTPTLVPLVGKTEFALTKKIWGAEIVNHLQTDKVYEVRLGDRTTSSRFDIYGVTGRFVVLRELCTNNYYEVPYNALHLYEKGVPDVKPDAKTGGFRSYVPPAAPSWKPKPSPTNPAASAAVPSLPLLDPKHIASPETPIPKAKSTKMGPGGIVYTLDPNLPIMPNLRSFGRCLPVTTKIIQSGQIATYLQTDKIYEVLRPDGRCMFGNRSIRSPVMICGATGRTVALRELYGDKKGTLYEVSFLFLRLYELSGTHPSNHSTSNLKPVASVPVTTATAAASEASSNVKSSLISTSGAVVSAASSATVHRPPINTPSPTVSAPAAPSPTVIAQAVSPNSVAPAGPTPPTPGPEEQPLIEGLPNIHQAIIKLMNCERMRDAIKKSDPTLYDAIVKYILDTTIAALNIK